MTFIRTTSAAIAALGLMACGAMAQDKAGGAAAPGGAPAAGSAGAAGGALRPPEAGAPAGGAGARPASPGMAPAGTNQAVPGARNAGENAGESPAQKPTTPGTAAEPGQPAGAAPNKNGHAEGQPGQAENGQAGKARGAARPAPQITNVQETRIKQSFKTVDVHPVNVNFNIGVGVAVPTSVVLQPLPPTIIDVVPGYEGYRFFVVPGQIVIVDPLSLEIVAVLPL